MKVYKSKVDWWLIALIVGIFGYPVIDGILEKQYIVSLVFFIIISVLMWLIHSIKYKIVGEVLILWIYKIEIKTIKRIYKTTIPLSSPAASLDRIAIVYNKYDEIYISPKNREDFIKELLKINSDIIVDV
ncbi:PH domain-containing protein [Flavobacterium sp.]|uniref:PH domain-containing protein n=1 Tax=Flavobacterium sp. TaxID=239 RepID=UPI0025C6E77A|nr:PH domain-containing protein [Flavobacterium sp.]MBA4153909.1 hypothetical protein [Flavobacterium sp.]